MKSKRLNRVKKVLLSVLATAILALIAVNVNLAQHNSALEAHVTLGSLEVLAQSEGGGSPYTMCETKETPYRDDYIASILYECSDGEYPMCLDGEILYTVNTWGGLTLVRDGVKTLFCF